jgi:predicted DsbA family dithiol-disulfide isomerase
MKKHITIDFVSDVACPWCAVGLSSLLLALKHLSDDVQADIAIHPFELNPGMRAEGETIVDYLGKKYGRTPEQIAETQTMIRERGAQVGFVFGPRTHVYNTFDAHRLLHWAGDAGEGKQLALKLALLQAYQGDGKDVSNHDVLTEAAVKVGLDETQARAVLDSTDRADAVRDEIAQYQAQGITSVPSIIFNGRYLISGGQPVETFIEAIRNIVDTVETVETRALTPDAGQ